MKFKKIFALTGITLAIGSVSISNAFSDVPLSHWAYKRISLMQAQEILSGFEDGTFKPDILVTREQFATILSKTVSKGNIKIQQNQDVNFYKCVDIKGRWAYEYIKNVFDVMGPGYIDGKDNKVYFRPEETMTREEVAKILVKVKGEKLVKNDEATRLLKQFNDMEMISDECFLYVGTAIREGIMTGQGEKFAPKEKLTRAEISVLMSKFLEISQDDNLKLTVIYSNGKFGYSNEYSNETIPCIYDIAWDFSEGVALVKKDGKYGYIDRYGDEVIPCVYEDGIMAEKVAVLLLENKYFYADKKMKIMVEWPYDTVMLDFSDGLALVSKDGKYGYIDSDGYEVIECIYDSAESFLDGKSRVIKDGKEMIIDKNGESIK